jgi:GNAT superfamily N-acetyltransferase
MDLGLRARAATALLELAFNPDQRRGPDGRWIKMGGKGSAGKSGPAVGRAPRAKKATAKKPVVNRSPSGKTGRAVDIMAELNARGAAAGAAIFEDAGEVSADVVKWTEQLFEFTDPQTGFTTNVSRVRARAAPDPKLGHGSSIVDAIVDITDQSGKKVGIASRKLLYNRAGDKLQMYHLSFKLDPKAQGGGFSKRWLAEMEDRYREAGIDQLALGASDKVGGYAWAKAGFDFEDAGSAEGIAARLKTMKNRLTRDGMTPEVKAQGDELIRRVRSGDPAERPTPMEFAMLGWTPGATTWPGKQLMLGASWHGVKDL